VAAGGHRAWGGPTVPVGDAAGRGRRTARHSSGAGRRRRRWVPWTVAGGLLVAGLAWAGWVASDAVTARDELLTAAAQVVDIQSLVLAGDAAGAEQSLAEVQAHAAAAREHTHGPHWSAATIVPWVGDNVRAVQVASEVVDDLAVRVLPDLMDVVAVVDPAALAPVDGRVDLAPLEAAAPVVVAADGEVSAARDRLATVADEDLWPAVAAPLGQLRDEVADVAMITATASRAVQLLPPMMGADGPRTYLLLVQNPAEPRATGGVPALVTVRAEGGAITVGDVVPATIGEPTPDAEPVVELTREERALFSNLMGSYMGDVTFTPDFPRSAEIARALWLAEGYEDVDGVLSIEPGAIGRVLGVTGPVTLSNGVVLNEQNAAQWLMNTVYLDYPDSADHDRLFAEAAASAFGSLMGGQWEPRAMVNALAGSARESRLMVWSAHPEEQELLAGTVLAGELRGNAGESPVIGLYFNDGSQSKIGYYLSADVSATTTQCLPDGSREVTVDVVLALAAPPDVSNYPPYVAGGQTTDPGSMRVNVLLYAPTGGRIEDVVIEGAEPGVTSQAHGGLTVVGKTVTLAAGQSATVGYRVTTGVVYLDDPLLRVSPLAAISIVDDLEGC